MANRTTNERFSRRRPAAGSQEGSSSSSSVMSMDDFDISEMIESEMDDGKKGLLTAAKKKKRNKNKGCWGNFWRMSMQTHVSSQKKLYDYLAEKSTVLNDSEIISKTSKTSNNSSSIQSNN
jgi:hypothetical protein